MFIDLEAGWENNQLRANASAIRVCSTPELNCLRGVTFRVVWPRVCDFYDIGERWEAVWNEDGDKVATEVISTFNRRGRHTEAVYYLLRSDGVDDYLYILLARRGMVGVIHDPQERGILASRADDADFLAELPRAGRESSEGFAISYLAGAANVETCNSRF